MAESSWGPSYDDYSQLDFELHTSPLFHQYGKALRDLPKASPALAFIDDWLNRYHTKAPNPESAGIEDILSALKRYIPATDDHKIFGHHYGYSCFRYLTYLMSLALINNSQVVDTLLKQLDDGAAWGDISEAAASEALEWIAEAIKGAPWFGVHFTLSPSCFSLIRNEDSAGAYASQIISMLWKDRGSFLALCSKGQLPGSTILLVVTWTFLSTSPDSKKIQDDFYLLQFLVIRVYLVSSPRDRQVLQPIFMDAMRRRPPLADDDPDIQFVSSEDSRIVLRAYSELLYTWQQSDALTRDIHLALIESISMFVTKTVSWFHTSTTIKAHMEVIRTSLALLWLTLEHRGPISKDEHPQIWLCVLGRFEWLRYILNKLDLTDQHWYTVAKILSEAQVINLIGRSILLPWTEEQKGAFGYTKDFHTLLDKMSALETIIGKVVKVAPELFDDSKTEWAKVWKPSVQTCSTPGVATASYNKAAIAEIARTPGVQVMVRCEYLWTRDICVDGVVQYYIVATSVGMHIGSLVLSNHINASASPTQRASRGSYRNVCVPVGYTCAQY